MTCPFFRLDSQFPKQRQVGFGTQTGKQIDVQESLTKVSSSATLGDLRFVEKPVWNPRAKERLALPPCLLKISL